MTRKKLAAALSAAALMITTAAYAAGMFGNWPQAGNSTYPQTLPFTGNETVPMDTNLGQGANPASEIASLAQLATYFGGQATSGNLLIGGDAATNLFQRATSGSSVTTTLTYGGPDMWAYWSGTNTAMTVSQDTTAADLSAGFPVAFKMARTSGQTGVVQMCMAQEVETNVVKMAGIPGNATTLELDFSAVTGANFSPSGANMTAFIIAGTGTDQGLAGSASMANGLNAGGGGSGNWTNQTNLTAAVISLGGVSTAGRYAAFAAVPATISSSNITELGVALCWTPTGTAGTNDYVAFSGIQLKKNPNASGLVNATAGYNCANTTAGTATAVCSNFERRPNVTEMVMQQRYYYELDESATIFVAGACKAESVTVATCYVQFPVTMRAAPTMSYATPGFATETTTAGGTLGACNTLATASTVASTAPNAQGVLIGCTATTVPAAGSAGMLYSNGGTGKIKASANL